MTDTIDYEYIVRATVGGGRVVSESSPRPHALSWTPTLGAALLRQRHPDVRVAQLRRLAGDTGPWEELTEGQIAEAQPDFGLLSPQVLRSGVALRHQRLGRS